jgi:NADPH:quinone reductase-like Zn-dependent oxidoreductase
MKLVTVKHPASLESLLVSESADPAEPGAGEIKVRIRASSLNYHDYAIVKGILPTADGRIPMTDGAGEVIAVGAGVSDFAVGDDVVSAFFPTWIDGAAPTDGFQSVPGDGLDGYAREQVTAPSLWFTRAPTGYSHAESATLTCAGVTAWRALMDDGALIPGATVLVQGTGGVSIFALQFAKAMGCTVIATSSSDEKLARLESLGADHLINYRTTEKWGAKALALTGGRGVDHVVEIGGAGTLNQSMIAARQGGHIALIGILAGFGGPVSTVTLMSKQLRVQGLTVGSRKHQQDLVRAMEKWGLKPVLDKSFALGDLADAFRYQESGAHFGKIIVEM